MSDQTFASCSGLDQRKASMGDTVSKNSRPLREDPTDQTFPETDRII
jgi:hypothetical protein